MKTAITALLLTLCTSTYGQADSVRGRQFQLTARMIKKLPFMTYCGVLASASVVEFEIIKLVGISSVSNRIAIIITCPKQYYGENFFRVGRTYHIIFSDKNQADFGWMLTNSEALKNNILPFEPWAVSTKRR